MYKKKVHIAPAVITVFLITLIFFGTKFVQDVISSAERIANQEINIINLNLLTQVRKKEIAAINQYLMNLIQFVTFENPSNNCFNETNWSFTSNITNENYNIFNIVTFETKLLLKICKSFYWKFPKSLQLNRLDYLPQLFGYSQSLMLSFVQSKNRTGFTTVLGITTTKRVKGNYLIPTIMNLISNINYEENNEETLIVVYIGETDIDYILSTAKEIEHEFPEFVQKGLIEIIAPSSSYYPDFNKLRLTLNDSLARVQWRSKQNLDISLLMAYAQSKGFYYVHLEDDIITKRGFIYTMKTFANIVSSEKRNWLFLDFCRLGFFGKMFKSINLSFVSIYLQIFFNEKPVDWLIRDLFKITHCNCVNYDSECKFRLSNILYPRDKHLPLSFLHPRAQFQHIGIYSSLSGKMQVLIDPSF